MWNKIVSWFKTTGVTGAIDALDYAVIPLATEIDKIETKFKNMESKEKAQWIVDHIQEFLRKKFSMKP